MFAVAAKRPCANAVAALVAALLSGCAWLAPMEVPPPPDLRVPDDGPAVVAKPRPTPMGGENFFQLSQGIEERSLVLVEGQPMAADARSLQRVTQAGPGPALSLDFKPNPAWKRAVIPPDSRSAIVGRVPPPAAIPGFTIGAGDTLQIDVLGRPELTARSNVSGDGRITAALLGPVNVGGLSTAQAAMQIADAYRERQFLVSPQVTVTMVEYQSQQLTVLGEVRNSGRYPMRTRLSVLDGLALSGGITEQGASTVYLLRPEDSVMTRYEIDLDALVQAGAGQQYFELIAGDTLVVPKSQLFYIYGEVKNPNAYRLKPGMTVIQALSLAGGLTDKGSDRRIDIRRQSDSHRLGSISASLNDPLQADDVIYVRERLF